MVKKEIEASKNFGALGKYNAVLFFGPPGSGKGTQAKILAEKNKKYLHFSTGDMFRALKNNPGMASSEIGQKISAVIAGGNLVPDDLTIELFFKTLEEYEKEGKYNAKEQILLLDGIPRNTNQVHLLKEKINVLKIVYLFASDLNVFANRIAKRASLEGRKDDADPKIVLNRLKVYETETLPLINEYAKDLIIKIDALPSIEEIQKNIVVSLQ